MLLVGVCVIPIRYIGKKMLARARVVQSSQGDLSSTLQENFSSQRDIRAFELEEQQTSLFRNRIHRYIQASISAVRWQSLLTPLIEFVSAIAMAATLFVGNMNGMNMGDFAALATAMYLCYEPVKKLGAVHNKAETLNAGLERINHVLDRSGRRSGTGKPEESGSLEGGSGVQQCVLRLPAGCSRHEEH